jgi:hypothetical protein
MTTKIIIPVLVIAAVFYWQVTSIVYRFRHPKQTETQLFLNTPKALIWR